VVVKLSLNLNFLLKMDYSHYFFRYLHISVELFAGLCFCKGLVVDFALILDSFPEVVDDDPRLARDGLTIPPCLKYILSN